MKTCFSCIFLLIVLVISSAFGINLYIQKGCSVTIDTIIKKDTLEYMNGSKVFLIGQNDNYIIATDPIFMKMPVDVLLNKISENKTYKLNTCGFRIPLINFNKIVIDANEIK